VAVPFRAKNSHRTRAELHNLENRNFENERLATIRDVLFQCYTELAYIDNGVPISIVKEMLGHSSVKKTGDSALTRIIINEYSFNNN